MRTCFSITFPSLCIILCLQVRFSSVQFPSDLGDFSGVRTKVVEADNATLLLKVVDDDLGVALTFLAWRSKKKFDEEYWLKGTNHGKIGKKPKINYVG